MIDQHGIGMTSQRTRKRLIDLLKEMGINDESVLQVMLSIPRHLFVEEALATRAYENTALPIGYGQTISQPYIVALMTSELFAGADRNKVLEIGTGCGYQTAILSKLCKQVYSVERITQLHRVARDRLYDLGVRNVTFRHADGFQGLEQQAPFDGILAAAVSDDVPVELTDQLAVGGRLIMPINKSDRQQLIVIDKTQEGLQERVVETVNFVPRKAGLI